MGILQKMGGQLWLQAGLGVGVATLSGTHTLSGTSAHFQSLTASGADRNVVFPALGGNGAGQWFFVRNAGASNNIVCKKSDGSTTIATLAPGQWAAIVSGKVSGVLDWYAMADVVSLVSLTLTGTLSAVAAAFTGAVTTTDGVASGTARKVGGLAYAATSAVTLTNSTSETDLGSYTIPANTLKAGTSLRFRAAVRVTGNAAADTITFKGKLGSTALFTSAAVAMVANDIAIVEGHITARAAPGASAAVASNTRATVTVGGTASSVGSVPAPSNFATNGALALKLTGQWSAASASDIAICDQFDVWAEG